jgi:hypothetical protein
MGIATISGAVSINKQISYSLKVTKEVESQDYYGPDPLELENNLTNST